MIFLQVERALSFFELLDQSVAPPEFWGPGDVIIGKYDRAEIQRYLLANQDPKEGRPPLQLKRVAPPRYRGKLNVGNAVHPHSFHLNADLRHTEGELPQFFTLGDTLASSLNLEFATLDMNREGQDPATRMLRSGHTPNLDIYIELGFSRCSYATTSVCGSSGLRAVPKPSPPTAPSFGLSPTAPSLSIPPDALAGGSRRAQGGAATGAPPAASEHRSLLHGQTPRPVVSRDARRQLAVSTWGLLARLSAAQRV